MEPSCWTYLLLRRWPTGRSARAVTTSASTNRRRVRGTGSAKSAARYRAPYRFSLKTKTIFEETKLPLRTWYKALLLMLTSKKGITALQIHRMLGTGSYRSAWYMCMRSARWMNDPEFKKSLWASSKSTKRMSAERKAINILESVVAQHRRHAGKSQSSARFPARATWSAR